MPTVSVCMGAYNAESTIGAVLDSVLAQTVPVHEILVLDDGSTDRTAEIAASKGVRVISVPNGGIAAARNRLIEEATGDLIALVDSDDDWLPEKLARQLPYFEDSEVVLVHADCWFVYEDGREVERNMKLDSPCPFDHILPSNWIITSSAVFRREAFLKAGRFPPEAIRCSDWYGWLILAPLGRFVHIQEKLVRYRVLSTSLANAGFRFHQGKRFMLKELILPRANELFKDLPDPARYRKMVEVNIGVAASTMAKYLGKEGRRNEARMLHREALQLARSIPRVWTRAIRFWLRLG